MELPSGLDFFFIHVNLSAGEDLTLQYSFLVVVRKLLRLERENS